MALFGLFESKKVSNTTNETDVLNLNQQIADQGIGISGDGNTIVQSDQGAIRAGLDATVLLTEAGYDLAEDLTGRGFDLAESLAGEAYQLVDQTTGRVISLSEFAIQEIARANTEALVYGQDVSQAAMAWADQATRSDDTVTTETLARYAAITAVALAALYLMMR